MVREWCIFAQQVVRMFWLKRMRVDLMCSR